MASPDEDRLGREGARIAIVGTPGGRYLRVVHVAHREPGRIFVIAACEPGGKPLAVFRPGSRNEDTCQVCSRRDAAA